MLGQYAKPARAKPHYMTDTQLDYLEGLFNEGEKDSSQRTSPEAAHEYMRAAIPTTSCSAAAARRQAPYPVRRRSRRGSRRRSGARRTGRGASVRRGRGASSVARRGMALGGGGGGGGGARRCGKCRGLGHNAASCKAPEWKKHDTWNDVCEICDAEEGDAMGDETLWYCRCCNIVVCKDGDGCMEKLDAKHPDTGGYSICTPPGEEDEHYICPACFHAHNADFVTESDDDE